VRRHLPDRLGAVARIDDRAHHLGDDVAGTLEHDRVADPQVLAPDLVDVVERRVAHGRPADEDRGDMRDRGHGAGPPDVDADLLELRGHLLGRELVGGRPARGARDEAEPLLVGQRVDLDDDPIGLVVELAARLGPLLGEGDDLLDALDRRVVRVDREAEAPEQLERLRVRASPWAPTSW
jgi:hypothetical protein